LILHVLIVFRLSHVTYYVAIWINCKLDLSNQLCKWSHVAKLINIELRGKKVYNYFYSNLGGIFLNSSNSIYYACTIGMDTQEWFFFRKPISWLSCLANCLPPRKAERGISQQTNQPTKSTITNPSPPLSLSVCAPSPSLVLIELFPRRFSIIKPYVL
jgi:hypothetical protein